MLPLVTTIVFRPNMDGMKVAAATRTDTVRVAPIAMNIRVFASFRKDGIRNFGSRGAEPNTGCVCCISLSPRIGAIANIPDASGSDTLKQSDSLAEAARVRSPVCAPVVGAPMRSTPVVDPRSPAPYTVVPLLNPEASHVDTPVLILRSSCAARVFSVVLLDNAYRSASEPPLLMVSGAYSTSPGAMLETLNTADVGDAFTSSVPVVKLLAGTTALSVNNAPVVVTTSAPPAAVRTSPEVINRTTPAPDWSIWPIPRMFESPYILFPLIWLTVRPVVLLSESL
jgi:hypothetical protein